MANVRSNFKNVEHTVVKLTFYTSGTENMTLLQGQDDNIVGSEGVTFVFAWKTRNENISDEEMQQYGSSATYGENFTFGEPRGKIP
jgi:hypothetical protein